MATRGERLKASIAAADEMADTELQIAKACAKDGDMVQMWVHHRRCDEHLARGSDLLERYMSYMRDQMQIRGDWKG